MPTTPEASPHTTSLWTLPIGDRIEDLARIALSCDRSGVGETAVVESLVNVAHWNAAMLLSAIELITGRSSSGNLHDSADGVPLAIERLRAAEAMVRRRAY